MQRRLLAVVAVALLAGCRAGGCAANVLGDVVGETGDAHCDRRFVAPGREPGSFCQEIIDTIATGEFVDDCRDKHAARADEGRCARERIIAGCKVGKENDDGSEVWDWFYDVSDLEDAGRADSSGEAGEPIFKDAARSKDAELARFAEVKRVLLVSRLDVKAERQIGRGDSVDGEQQILSRDTGLARDARRRDLDDLEASSQRRRGAVRSALDPAHLRSEEVLHSPIVRKLRSCVKSGPQGRGR